MPKQVNVLSTDQTIALFRQYGIPISFEKLTALIDSEKVDWAISVQRKNSDDRYRMIFEKPLLEWLNNLSSECRETY